MIYEGHMGAGRLVHNGSFFVILPQGDIEVGLKLQWGDFDQRDVADMRLQVSPTTGALLRTLDWIVGQDTAHTAHVPAGTEVYVLGEHDSYWDAEKRGAVLTSTGKASNDPKSRSAYRDTLPAEAVVLDAGYVRAFARGIWKDGTYTSFSWQECDIRQLAWSENNRKAVT